MQIQKRILVGVSVWGRVSKIIQKPLFRNIGVCKTEFVNQTNRRTNLRWTDSLHRSHPWRFSDPASPARYSFRSVCINDKNFMIYSIEYVLVGFCHRILLSEFKITVINACGFCLIIKKKKNWSLWTFCLIIGKGLFFVNVLSSGLYWRVIFRFPNCRRILVLCVNLMWTVFCFV